jgi:3-isopropylmalate dehydratase small subunit
MARAWRFGDFVNTDQIIPGRDNVTTDPGELDRACFIEHGPEFAAEVRPGDVIVAGEEFGCGSSGEHAVIAILATGVSAVPATSFARIFYCYCNAINRGLALLECPEAAAVEDGAEVELDPARGRVLDRTGNRELLTRPLPELTQRIARHGGVVELVRAHGSLNRACGSECEPAPLPDSSE